MVHEVVDCGVCVRAHVCVLSFLSTDSYTSDKRTDISVLERKKKHTRKTHRCVNESRMRYDRYDTMVDVRWVPFKFEQYWLTTGRAFPSCNHVEHESAFHTEFRKSRRHNSQAVSVDIILSKTEHSKCIAWPSDI